MCNVAASLIDIPKSEMLCWGNVYDILINAAKFPSRKTLPAFLATNIICYLFFFFFQKSRKDPKVIVDSFNLHCANYIRIHFYHLSIDL